MTEPRLICRCPRARVHVIPDVQGDVRGAEKPDAGDGEGSFGRAIDTPITREGEFWEALFHGLDMRYHLGDSTDPADNHRLKLFMYRADKLLLRDRKAAGTRFV